MKIAIAGYGVEGKSALKYYMNKEPKADFTVFDERDNLTDIPSNVKTVLGKGAFAKISGYDLIVRSPSVPPRVLGQADNHWSSTREFLHECPAPIISVTGSKGKGTTCSLIAAILREHLKGTNRQVHLIGNIGVPVLDVLPDVKSDDIVVYEMSSFQLWDVTESPHIGVITMIEPDHLNVHKDFAEYVEAKSHVIKYQQAGDVAVFNEENEVTNELAQAVQTTSPATFIPFPDKSSVYFDDKNFYCGLSGKSETICSVDELKLPGDHNKRNACAAIAATWELTNHDKAAIAQGFSAFHGLPHRLKFVREVNGTKFYDDSIATTPGSAIAAVKSFKEPKVLIVGGSDKGADYYELGEAIEQSNVRLVLAIGANRAKIAEQVGSKTKVPVTQLADTAMETIVSTAYDLANPDEVVILSPAAASFDMFKSYKDRGEQFITAVNRLR